MRGNQGEVKSESGYPVKPPRRKKFKDTYKNKPSFSETDCKSSSIVSDEWSSSTMSGDQSLASSTGSTVIEQETESVHTVADTRQSKSLPDLDEKPNTSSRPGSGHIRVYGPKSSQNKENENAESRKISNDNAIADNTVALENAETNGDSVYHEIDAQNQITESASEDDGLYLNEEIYGTQIERTNFKQRSSEVDLIAVNSDDGQNSKSASVISDERPLSVLSTDNTPKDLYSNRKRPDQIYGNQIKRTYLRHWSSESDLGTVNSDDDHSSAIFSDCKSSSIISDGWSSSTMSGDQSSASSTGSTVIEQEKESVNTVECAIRSKFLLDSDGKPDTPLRPLSMTGSEYTRVYGPTGSQNQENEVEKSREMTNDKRIPENDTTADTVASANAEANGDSLYHEAGTQNQISSDSASEEDDVQYDVPITPGVQHLHINITFNLSDSSKQRRRNRLKCTSTKNQRIDRRKQRLTTSTTEKAKKSDSETAETSKEIPNTPSTRPPILSNEGKVIENTEAKTSKDVQKGTAKNPKRPSLPRTVTRKLSKSFSLFSPKKMIRTPSFRSWKEELYDEIKLSDGIAIDDNTAEPEVKQDVLKGTVKTPKSSTEPRPGKLSKSKSMSLPRPKKLVTNLLAGAVDNTAEPEVKQSFQNSTQRLPSDPNDSGSTPTWLFSYKHKREAEDQLTDQNGSFVVIEEDKEKMPFTPYKLVVVHNGQRKKIPVLKHRLIQNKLMPKIERYSLACSPGRKMKSIFDIVNFFQIHDIGGLKLRLKLKPAEATSMKPP